MLMKEEIWMHVILQINQREPERYHAMDLIKNIDVVLKLWKFNGNDAMKITKRCKTK